MKDTVDKVMELLDNAASENIGLVISFGGTMNISEVERYREYIENSGFYCSYTRQGDQTSFDVWV
jgi:hypothetical protein